MGENSWARVIAGASPPQVPPPSHPSLDAPVPTPPSATYQRLRQTIAERMPMR